jgi:hypothetical protein
VLVGALGSLALVSVSAACGAGHRTQSGGAHGSASITIDHHRRALDVTSCTREAHAVHVIAQAAGGWTLDLRQDGTNHNAMLVLVHDAVSGVQSFQASANVLHPHGNPPSRIQVARDGTHLSGSATLLRSSGAATTPASFEITCADIDPTA